MSGEQLLTLWSNSVAVSGVVWLTLLIVVLYVARQPAHQFMRALMRTLHRSLRLASRALMAAEARLRERNREVLLAQAREHQTQKLHREMERVAAYVNRDLSGYPSLHRKLSELATRVEEDFQNSSEVPPPPPAWINAIEAIAKIPSNGDAMTGKILRNTETILERASKDVVAEYQKATGTRHKLLQKMLPEWRQMNHQLEAVDRMYAGLDERTQKIDNQMLRYEEVLAGTDRVEETLKSSALTQFFVASLLLGITIVGGIINFNLIAMPMSEMVGGASYIGPFRASDVAALMLIAMELSTGVFLMDSLRFTHLFPVIGTLEDKIRHRVTALMLVFLATLAFIEAGLAFMRDMLAADHQALVQQLAGAAVPATAAMQYSWLPSVAQMVLGFILPFLLAWSAIPLEMFVHSGRTVGGLASASALRISAFSLRLVGTLADALGKLLISLYDALVSPLLLGERGIRNLLAGQARKRTA